MSENKPTIGAISWVDLTVPNADSNRKFYETVAGWTSSPVDMGGYNDFSMNRSDGETVAGICHAKGENAHLPPQWLIYITVADLNASVEACKRLGGKLISPARELGNGHVAVIQDPAGAVAALYQITA